MADLSAFTLYNNRSLGGIGAEEINTPQAQQMLQQLRQYDPNANFRPTYGSDGQLIGYTLDVDASKLPGASGTGSLGGTSGHGSGADFMPSFSTVQDNMHLANPNAVTNSPIYGKITDNRNIQQIDDWIAKGGGPALVAAFAFGIPYLASAMSGGAIGGAGAAGAAAGGGAGGGASGGASGAAGGIDMTGFQVPGGASGAFDAALGGGAPAASLPGFQIPGGAAGLFGPASAGVSPSTAAILSDINAPLFDIGGPASAAFSLGNGTQAAAPIVEQGTPARVSDVLRNGGIPGLSNIGQSLSELPIGNILNAAGKIPGVGGAGGGSGGGGGGGLLAQPYNMQPYKSLTALLRNYGLLGMPNG